MKDIKIFLKKEKEKKQEYGRARYKNLSENENSKTYLVQEKILQNEKKMSYYNYKKLLFFKKNDLGSSFDEE